MEAYQQRVIDEQEELQEKCDKLESFLMSEKFSELEEYEQDLLAKQLRHMNVYNTVLIQRIELFSKG